MPNVARVWRYDANMLVITNWLGLVRVAIYIRLSITLWYFTCRSTLRCWDLAMMANIFSSKRLLTGFNRFVPVLFESLFISCSWPNEANLSVSQVILKPAKQLKFPRFLTRNCFLSLQYKLLTASLSATTISGQQRSTLLLHLSLQTYTVLRPSLLSCRFLNYERATCSKFSVASCNHCNSSWVSKLISFVAHSMTKELKVPHTLVYQVHRLGKQFWYLCVSFSTLAEERGKTLTW